MLYIPKKNKLGFTLVEVLIVTVMLPVISLSIYSAFNNGIKIWKRVNNPAIEEDVNIFFEKFNYDIQNSFKFEGIDFSGKHNMISFPTLVFSDRMNNRTVGQVTYLYDISKRSIIKEEKDYSHIYNIKEGKRKNLLTNIKELEFSYCYYDKQEKKYYWQAEGIDGFFAVKVKIKIVKDGIFKEFIKTVTVQSRIGT
ncbi:MAG: prepilin-type N-terminal cleavage/methylation domain-containing protein [Candidatus Omnitrophica bacterium]|nr:prepilin-type N-terminal cleavage/methylation domain-containing protein [Candidatus Omnitrophota bacterium]